MKRLMKLLNKCVDETKAFDASLETNIQNTEQALLHELRTLQKKYKERIHRPYHVEMFKDSMFISECNIPYFRIDDMIEQLNTVKRIKEIKDELGIE